MAQTIRRQLLTARTRAGSGFPRSHFPPGTAVIGRFVPARIPGLVPYRHFRLTAFVGAPTLTPYPVSGNDWLEG